MRYHLRDRQVGVFFTDQGFWLSVARESQALGVKLELAGAAPKEIEGVESAGCKVNSYAGAPDTWETGRRTYRRLTYREAWPSIDVVYEPVRNGLEYSLIVKPGAQLSNVNFSYEGVERLSLDSEGNLVLHTQYGDLVESRPKAYQNIGSGKKEVSSTFVLTGAQSYSIQVGEFDRTVALVIDPTLDYSTFLGGGWGSVQSGLSASAADVQVDAAGCAYVVGWTSGDFPTTPGAYQQTLPPSASAAIYITKLTDDGSGVVWSTLLGGGAQATPYRTAIDGAGNLYLMGEVSTNGFPTTAGAIKTTVGGPFDLFVVKINSGGSLAWSTLLGGSGDDRAGSIAVDPSGNAYVLWNTFSTDCPTTPGALSASLQGPSDMVVTCFDSTGALSWSTYWGGTGYELGRNLAVDSSGNVYLTGESSSADYPVTPGCYQTTWNYDHQPVVTKLNAGGASIAWSTFFGTAGEFKDLAINASGDVTLAGSGGVMPTTPGVLATAPIGNTTNVYVAKLAADGATLTWATYIGPGGAQHMMIDAAGAVYVAGLTSIGTFPVTPGAFQPAIGGSADVIVFKLNSTGTALDWSTFLGGTQVDGIGGLGIDPSGNAYVSGATMSNPFPSTPGSLMPDPGYSGSAQVGYLTKINSGGAALGYSTYLHGLVGDHGRSIATDDLGNVYVTGWTFSPNFPVTAGAFVTNGTTVLNGFLAKYSTSGLEWCTYLKGSTKANAGHYVAAVPGGGVGVAGDASSSDFPTTPGAFQTVMSGSSDLFVAKFDSDGLVQWSTFIGGNSGESVGGLAIGPGGDIFLTGATSSANFPTTAGAWRTTKQGGSDGFALRLNSSGTALVWSTLFGGSNDDSPHALSVNANGDVAITGETKSVDFPTSVGAYDASGNGQTDVFVTTILSGGGLGFSTLIGGPGFDIGRGVAFGPGGEVYVAGAASSGFPGTPGAYSSSMSGTADAFVAKVSSDGMSLLWSTFLGGTGFDEAVGLSRDSAGNLVVAGNTVSTNFPTTPDGVQLLSKGQYDVFVARLTGDGTALLWSTYLGGTFSDVADALDLDVADNIFVTGATQSADFPATGGSAVYGGAYDAFVVRLGSSAPPPPVALAASPGNGTNSVTWTSSAGAASYVLYRATAPGVTKANYASLAGGVRMVGVTSLHSDAGLTNGTTYYYVLTAVNSFGEGRESVEVSSTPGQPPAPPGGVAAQPGPMKATLTWSASGGAASYVLYRSPIAGVTKATYAAVPGSVRIPGVGSPYVDTGLVNGDTYYYFVTAVNYIGESSESSEVSVKPGASIGVGGGCGLIGLEGLILLLILRRLTRSC